MLPKSSGAVMSRYILIQPQGSQHKRVYLEIPEAYGVSPLHLQHAPRYWPATGRQDTNTHC